GRVGLNQAETVQIIAAGVQGDRAFVSLAGLDQHTGVSIDRVLMEIFGSLFERVDALDDPFDPTGSKSRTRILGGTGITYPGAPIHLATHVVASVPDDKPVVHQGEKTGLLAIANRNGVQTAGCRLPEPPSAEVRHGPSHRVGLRQ